MQPDDRKAFDAILAEIFAAIDKPLGEAKAEAFWKGLQRMSPIEFARCRDHIIEALQSHEAPRIFSVAYIWDVKRQVRARGPQAPSAPRWIGDKFDEMGNNRLLAHVMRRALKGVHYTDSKRNPHSDESRALIAPLVACMRAWVVDVRESTEFVNAETGEIQMVPLDVQQRWWDDCMRRAELEVDKAREHFAPKKAA